MNCDFGYVDIAFKNGSVITVDSANTISEAVGIKENKIVAVGSNSEVEAIINDKTTVIDLQGRSLLPDSSTVTIIQY